MPTKTAFRDYNKLLPGRLTPSRIQTAVSGTEGGRSNEEAKGHGL